MEVKYKKQYIEDTKSFYNNFVEKYNREKHLDYLGSFDKLHTEYKDKYDEHKFGFSKGIENLKEIIFFKLSSPNKISLIDYCKLYSSQLDIMIKILEQYENFVSHNCTDNICQIGGNYYNKYVKYKNKYISQKKLL